MSTIQPLPAPMIGAVNRLQVTCITVEPVDKDRSCVTVHTRSGQVRSPYIAHEEAAALVGRIVATIKGTEAPQ